MICDVTRASGKNIFSFFFEAVCLLLLPNLLIMVVSLRSRICPRWMRPAKDTGQCINASAPTRRIVQTWSLWSVEQSRQYIGVPSARTKVRFCLESHVHTSLWRPLKFSRSKDYTIKKCIILQCLTYWIYIQVVLPKHVMLYNILYIYTTVIYTMT